jgi:drug/metabolite transporter (DMT)-like permease
MLLGIIAGLVTCALWGLTFVAPRAVAPFTTWDLTIARYGIFGLACLLLMLDRRFRPAGFAPLRLLTGLLLGGAGYVGYFVSAAFAVQLAGAAIPPVVIGTMPVFLAIVANTRDRSAPWQALAMPLMLTAVGVAIVNVATIGAAEVSNAASITLGILASCMALVIWIAYGLANAAVMRRTGCNGQGFKASAQPSEVCFCCRWPLSGWRTRSQLPSSSTSSDGLR